MSVWPYALVAISLMFLISLYQAYTETPEKELKRRARSGDELAKALYRAASYGVSLRYTFLTIIGINTALLFMMLATVTPAWVNVIIMSIILWVGIAWLPSAHVSRLVSLMAGKLAPLVSKVVAWMHPLFGILDKIYRKIHPIHLHTGLYEKQDLIDLLQRQEIQADNRIQQTELVLAERALKFGDRKVHDKLVPRRIVKTVSTDEDIGPLLMDELHKSGHSRFPVFKDKKENIVGTLYLKDLVKSKHGGSVAKAMRPDVCYIHEDQPLIEALQAVLKTHHHLLVVVNSFEEYVGVISLEDVVEELIGQQIIDEFDQYHDLRAVAAKMAANEHQDHEKATSEVQEMIESQHDTDTSVSSPDS